MGDIFGGLFDFDLDGKTDAFEVALGMNMVFEDEERSKRAMRFDNAFDADDDDLDLMDEDDLDHDDF